MFYSIALSKTWLLYLRLSTSILRDLQLFIGPVAGIQRLLYLSDWNTCKETSDQDLELAPAYRLR